MYLLFGVTACGLLFALAAVMIRRRLWRQYPFFFVYIVYTFLGTVLLMSVSSRPLAYYYTYWITESFSAVFVVLALHEAFHDVFRAFYLLWWFRLIFPGVLSIVAFLSVRHALQNPLPHVPQLMAIILSVDTATAYIKAGVFVTFMLLVVVLHVRWRRYPYDIALGFAISCLGLLIMYAFLRTFGLKYKYVIAYAPAIGYIFAIAFWLWSFAAKVEAEPTAEWKDDVTPEELFQQVTDYIRILKRGSGEAQ